jgi:hypothetical protein
LQLDIQNECGEGKADDIQVTDFCTSNFETNNLLFNWNSVPSEAFIFVDTQGQEGTYFVCQFKEAGTTITVNVIDPNAPIPAQCQIPNDSTVLVFT